MCTSLSLLASPSADPSPCPLSPVVGCCPVVFAPEPVPLCPVAAVVVAPVCGVLRWLLSLRLLGWGLVPPPPGVVGVEPEAPFAVPAQASSTGEASRPGISLLLRRTELKNFSAVLRSLKVISVEAGVV